MRFYNNLNILQPLKAESSLNISLNTCSCNSLAFYKPGGFVKV